ncbi:hypothetical protein EXD60_07800 [Campylobacter upsaliensis]|nr:hypothetical protein [Campylobacter upsaliensis]EAH9148431.1 hypothetical protein [Campylobacter upsaliensis]
MKIYDDILEKYEKSVLEYQQLIKLKREIKRKLESLSNMVFKAKIYIQSQPKETDNILEFISNSKSFHLELKQMGLYNFCEDKINHQTEYNEDEIEKLKTPFLEFLQEDS